MSGHTPGPWILEEFDEESGQARIVQRSQKPGRDAWWQSTWMYTGSEADARLIAAAPDLLAAADALIAASRMSPADVRATFDAMVALELAAAKARGVP